MFRSKPLRFVTLGDDCYVVVSHKLNHDGYFRKRWKQSAEMFHRLIWQHHNGPIPTGFEVDHICRNRACCNIKHLRLLDKQSHTVHTNTTRYKDRKDKAYAYWLTHRPTGTSLGETFGVTFSAACRWIREWTKQRNQEVSNCTLKET